jgi:hypothetical protein
MEGVFNGLFNALLYSPIKTTREMFKVTAYDLFNKAYMHYMGSSVRHLVDGTSPKEFILQTFNEALEEYYIDEAYDTWILLTFANPANDKQRSIEELKSIEVKAGYYLCQHDGHNEEYIFMWYATKAEATAAYKSLFMRYFRRQVWYWTVKIN